MPFRETYSKCLTTLAVSQRVEIDESSVVAAEERLGVRLPTALREFYLTCGSWDLNVAHNRLFAPNEVRWMNDRLVFYEESEKLAHWGIHRPELANDDPVVAQGIKERGRLRWYDEELSCEKFLVLMTYWQALAGGLGFAAVATLPGLWSAVKPGWVLQGNNGPMIVYAKDRAVLGVLYDEEDDVTSLHTAAVDLERLNAVSAEYSDAEWEVILGDEDLGDGEDSQDDE